MHPTSPPPPPSPQPQPPHGRQEYGRPRYEQPLTPDWDPVPHRSRTGLIVRHICTVIYFPVHVVLCLAVFAVLLAIGLVGEVLWFLEKPLDRLMDRALDPLPVRPRWWVTWSELRHEGDPDFHRARVEKLLTAKKPTTTTALLRFHYYRGIGARGALDIAARHGWQPDPEKRPRPLRQLDLVRLPQGGVS